VTTTSDVEADHALGRPGVRLADLGPRASRAVALALALGLVAGLVWAVALVRGAGDEARTSSAAAAASDQQARRDVQLAVAAFATGFNNYTVEDIGGYKQRMLPLMTEKFGQSFTYAVDGIVSEVKATEMASVGEVVQTAVSAIDDDSATVLVVADVDVSSALGERERHFRWKVSVLRDRASGSWLVDDFQPVA
jgi:hypothetical protein